MPEWGPNNNIRGTMFNHLHLHTNYSHDCTSKIKKIVKHVKQLGQTACAITDHGNMSGCVEFYLECKKNGIKPIIGMEAYITKDGKPANQKDSSNKELNHLVLLAKNKVGYQNLLKLVYLSNQAENSYYRPRIDEQMLFANSEGIICINGHHSTSLFDALFFNTKGVLNASSLEEAAQYRNDDIEEAFLNIANRYRNVFGEDFYIECQLFDRGDMLQQNAAYTLYELANKHGFKSVGTGDAHYITKQDSLTHKVFVAIKQNCKVDDLPDIRYFTHDEYYIFGEDVAQECYPQALIEATQEIADKVEQYDITRPASIPQFGDRPNEELEEICLKNIGVVCPDTPEHRERLNYELPIIKSANLSSYFLIVADYINWANSKKILTGPSRGSAGGCLVSYLTRITKIDPLKYGLMFDRFYNVIRAEAKQLPDIDSDFPATRREEVIDYIKSKYGKENVCGVVTFSTLQGKGAMKDTLRAFGVCDFRQMNEISDLIPARERISDKLADFKDETGSESIIEYVLHKEPDTLREYAYIDENGEIAGPYAPYFKVAIDLEGAIKSESRHASAYIISDIPVHTVAPMIKDKGSDNLVCALDMHGFEAVGLNKFDILSLKSLDGLMEINNLLKEVGI